MAALSIGPVRPSILHGNSKYEQIPSSKVSVRYSVTADGRRSCRSYRPHTFFISVRC